MKKALIATLILLWSAGQAWAIGGIADITVYDRAENRTLPVFFHEGRYYIAGKPGNEYQVSIRNNQAGDVLSVISVDGVNAVSGETANWAQTGYVLGANSSFAVKGWRKSTQRVAAFFFTELENSYAARTGRPDNVGVIGVAVFRRKPEPVARVQRDWRPSAPASGSASARLRSADGPSAQANEADAAAPRPAIVESQPVEKSLGTGHGKSETSVVRYTNFERASQNPDEVITIYYDSYRNLVAQGVIRDAPRVARPSAFPGQFVPDPR